MREGDGSKFADASEGLKQKGGWKNVKANHLYFVFGFHMGCVLPGVEESRLECSAWC
jgi:hypothetical protein